MNKVLKGLALFCLCGLLATSCGSASDVAIDKMLRDMDAGDFDSAVIAGKAAQAKDPNNFSLSMLLSTAYAGRAGIDIFAMTTSLTDATLTDNAFEEIHRILVTNIGAGGLADLRLAVSTLGDFEGIIDDTRNFRFQLGLFQMIESFALPTITAQPTQSNTVVVGGISAGDKANVQSDFLEADNNLILGGVSATNQIVDTLRKNYCILKIQSTGSGFTLAELQDITLCQLAGAGSTTSSVASCLAFDFTRCSGVDTEL
jgi:hypothetical protein